MSNSAHAEEQEIRMTDKSRQKIMDVMHTLSCIVDGRATMPKESAKACWNVLNEVLESEDKL